MTAAVAAPVLDGDSARIVQRVEVDRLLRVDSRIEARMPISDTASGRVLTAWALPHDLEALRDAGRRGPGPPRRRSPAP
nr:hypothetical protein [Streptomyces sp. QL37]